MKGAKEITVKQFMRLHDFCEETGLHKDYVMRIVRVIPSTGFKMSNKPNSPYIVKTDSFMRALHSGKAQRYVE